MFFVCSVEVIAGTATREFHMGSKPIARFTVEVLGQPRSLFSVSENKDHTLTLRLTNLGLHKTYGQNSSEISRLPAILHQYYSIHSSKTSPEGVNAIVQHKIVEGPHEYETRHYTKAIKRGNAFASLFFRRCTTLTHPSYIPKPRRGTMVSIGRYDPSAFTLFYNVVAGARGYELAIDDPKIAASFFDFRNVRITVLSVFVSIPASNSSYTGHSETSADEEESHLMDGIDAPSCQFHFWEQNVFLTKELIESLRNERTDAEIESYQEAAFFKEGVPASYPFSIYNRLVRGNRTIVGYLTPWPLG